MGVYCEEHAKLNRQKTKKFTRSMSKPARRRWWRLNLARFLERNPRYYKTPKQRRKRARYLKERRKQLSRCSIPRRRRISTSTLITSP